MYYLKIEPDLEKTLKKLAKKNKKQLEIILSKAEEIVENPHRYKNLRAPLNMWKRVHIDKHFVLAFSVNDENNTVTLEDYAHHDEIYK
ncbi:type II toxin-antitoxin system RelE family toxin [Methanolobus bombayensis]|uniref:type II toxin-antitoxin system RelE family toxin n=1 Tax=Methanolobus bombayensis TaxID=38023 RepID=UPI001AE329D2|nr:type II toxin-antitoxin system RelE/ParE family toxin [Methanolobus bombayensis]